MATETANRIVISEPDAPRILQDTRADDGHRRVSMNARRVLIERCVSGVAMQVGVPTQCYTGVVMSLENGARERICRVSLAHRDPDLAVSLSVTSEADGLIEWNRWALYFDLPRMVERHDGSLAQVAEDMGQATAGVAATTRRRNAAITKRRPRFCTRRRVGRPLAIPGVFAGEREIISYE